MDGNESNVTQLKNVVDIKTGRPVLPSKIRGMLIGQYAESKSLNQTPDEFVAALEKRILGDIAQAGLDFVRDAFSSMQNPPAPRRRG